MRQKIIDRVNALQGIRDPALAEELVSELCALGVVATHEGGRWTMSYRSLREMYRSDEPRKGFYQEGPVKMLEGYPPEDHGVETGVWTEPFCVCGRRLSQCDGSRKDCVKNS